MPAEIARHSAEELEEFRRLPFTEVCFRVVRPFATPFMARLMGYFVRGETRLLTVLVATSGDTGSAVAHGFLNVPGIRVVILYPSKRISEAQEKQFTTLGENITALEVAGTFDDC